MSNFYIKFRDTALRAGEAAFLCVPPKVDRDYDREGRTISYAQALQSVDALADLYATSGLSGRRVALLLENRPDHFLHLLAANAARVSVVPLNPDYLANEFAYVLDHAEVCCVIGTGRRFQDLAIVCQQDERRIPIIDAMALPDRLPVKERSGTGIGSASALVTAGEALVIYTSGTTGHPKGCIISNECCLAAGECYASIGGAMTLREGEDRLYVPLPTYHANATVIAMNAMIRTANCLILPDRFHAGDWWGDLIHTGATAVHYLGIIPPILLKAAPSARDRQHRVRFGFGAGVAPELHAAFESRFGFPLVEGWGMTETGRIIVDAQEPRLIATRAIGCAADPLEVKVVDDADVAVGLDVPGELLVRCKGEDPRRGFFGGYLKDDPATEAAWRGGWFHTGDIVTCDASGRLFFVERRKNIIRRSGENISAAEVEGVLSDLPFVASVAVIGIEDDMRDEEVMACVVLVNGAAPTAVVAMGLFEAARGRLAYFKLPGWVVFVDTIPVTGTQKIRKGVIFPQYADPRKHPHAYDLRYMKKR
jgi:crotonobetaine/carnitine-CoA ligase